MLFPDPRDMFPDWQLTDGRRAGPSNAVSHSQMTKLERDIERLELGRQSDNQYYSKKLEHIDEKLATVEGDVGTVRDRLTVVESIQDRNSRQIGEVLTTVQQMGNNVNLFLEASRNRFDDIDHQVRRNRHELDSLPNFFAPATANNRSSNPAYSPAQLQGSSGNPLGAHISPHSSYPHPQTQQLVQPTFNPPPTDQPNINWFGSHDDFRGGMSYGSGRRSRQEAVGPVVRSASGHSTSAEQLPQMTNRQVPVDHDYGPAIEDFAHQYLNDYPTGPVIGDGAPGAAAPLERQSAAVPQLTIQPPSQTTADSSSLPASPHGLLAPVDDPRTTRLDSGDRMQLLATIAGQTSPIANHPLREMEREGVTVSAAGPVPPTFDERVREDRVADQASERVPEGRAGEHVSDGPSRLEIAITPPNDLPRPTVQATRASSRQRSVGPPSNVVTRSASRSREASMQPIGRRTRSNSVSSANGASGRG